MPYCVYQSFIIKINVYFTFKSIATFLVKSLGLNIMSASLAVWTFMESM